MGTGCGVKRLPTTLGAEFCCGKMVLRTSKWLSGCIGFEKSDEKAKFICGCIMKFIATRLKLATMVESGYQYLAAFLLKAEMDKLRCP
jgi:hypothetical protein